MRVMMIPTVAIALVAGTLSPAWAGQVFAIASAQSTPCTSASWNGTYGYLKVGKTPEGPLNSIGNATFDGEGNWRGNGQTYDMNGKFGYTFGGVGTYSINPDCSGTQMDKTGRVGAHLMVIHDGSQGLAMAMTPGRNIPLQSQVVAEAWMGHLGE